MKHSLEAVDVIWKTVNVIYNQINGGIYKLTRPVDSKLEDIVVNALPINSENIQRCIVNVNCYVPDMLVNIKGKSILMANTARLKELATAVMDILEDKADMGYYFHLQNQHILKADEDQHYVNLRIEVVFTNEI
jgi:hypothetical protein